VDQPKIVTLFEAALPASSSDSALSPRLSAFYGGSLSFPQPHPGRPVIIGNFVQTLDGVISLKAPGRSGGGEISGFNLEDRFIMALLRAHADAVMVASRTLHEDSGHVRIPAFIYPALEADFLTLRHRLGKDTPHPLNVVVTGSGRLNLEEKTFSTAGLRTLVLTTHTGAQQLQHAYGARLPGLTTVRVLPGVTEVDPADIARTLWRDYGVQLLLHEGGATFFGTFLKQRLIDELFLTVAPQIVGPGSRRERPAFSGALNGSPSPDESIWGILLSIKMPQEGSHLYLRYRLPVSEMARSVDDKPLRG
jgi:riboflavin biosynthesis pyrimidine reductase